MATPHTFETSLRAHDVAVHNWLATLHVDYPPDPDGAWTQRKDYPILRVRAGIKEAHASLVSTLVREGWFKDEATASAMRQAASDIKVVPYPFVSWKRGDPEIDATYAGTAKRARTEVDPLTGRVVKHAWPGHYMTEYSITFWSLKTLTDDFLREWIMGQLGQIGANHNEFYLPVQHASPWGLQRQAMILTGMADESPYQGPDLMVKSFTATFRLRTWIMRMTEAAAYPMTTLANATEAVVDDSGDDQIVNSEPLQQGGNVFTVPMSPFQVKHFWPKTGDAVVANPEPGALSINLPDVDASVDLIELPVGLSEGDVLYSISFDYTSTTGFQLDAGQRTSASNPRSSRMSLFVPKSVKPGRVHRFARFTQIIGSFTVATVSGAANAKLWNININRVYPTGRLAPVTVTGQSATFNLPPQPHLVVVSFGETDNTIQLSVDDDAVSRVNRKSLTVDPATNTEAVLLSQPLSGTLKVNWNVGTTVASVWAQRYDPPYHGNTVS